MEPLKEKYSIILSCYFLTSIDDKGHNSISQFLELNKKKISMHSKSPLEEEGSPLKINCQTSPFSKDLLNILFRWKWLLNSNVFFWWLLTVTSFVIALFALKYLKYAFGLQGLDQKQEGRCFTNTPPYEGKSASKRDKN